MPLTALALLGLILTVTTRAQAPPPYRDASLSVEQRVADLLRRMTLEEKVAQTLAMWQQKRQLVDDTGEFAPDRAAEHLRQGLGQITRPSDGLERRNRPRDPRETVVFVNAIQQWVVDNTRLGIPVMFHEEALHGLSASKATMYPQPIALAGTWDDELVERVFTATALEVRGRGSQMVLSPVLDLARDPRWGRSEETYGEDPYLVARMGLAAIRGYQGPMPVLTAGRVFAAAKHFAGHGSHEGGINTAPTPITPRVLREEILYPFERAVKEAHVAAIMPSYNEIDGLPSHANAPLLDGILRKQWGWDGVVVSDYSGIDQLQNRHHVAASLADAARLALAAGVDLELPDKRAYPLLVEEVRAGRLDEALLDRSVARILRLKFLAGLFEHPYADPTEAGRVTNTPAHQALALEAARKALTLLKNEGGLLPLDRTKIRRLAVIGPNAGQVHLGGYSGDPGRGVSVLDGIRDKAGRGIAVTHAVGVKITETDPALRASHVVPGDPVLNRQRIAEAVEVARDADVVVLVLGTNETTAREAWADTHLGDAATLALTGNQMDLVDAIVALKKPTIAVLVNGRPLALTRLAAAVPAILEGWYLGQEGGTAVGEALFGDLNPGGKLPVSLARSVGQLPVYYNRRPTSFRDYLFETRTPLYPFGHGLSYTTFELRDLVLAPATIGPGGRTVARVTVTNTGRRAGDEVVQLYARDLVGSVTRPVKQLRGFRRVTLEPGASATVEFPLGPMDLSLIDQDLRRVVEPGEFEILAGTSSETTLKATLTVAAEPRSAGGGSPQRH